MPRKQPTNDRAFTAQQPPSFWLQPVRQAARVEWVALGLLAVGVLASAISTLAGWRLAPDWRWTEGLIPVLASVAVLASLASRLPLQNVLFCGVLVFLTAGMVMAVGAFSGSPLGRFEFTRELGPRLLAHVAWPAPFLWLAVVLSARQTARVILRPWRRIKYYGWWLLGVSLGLGLGLSLVLEPFGRRVLGWWQWSAVVTGHTHWLGAPVFFPVAVAVFLLVLLLIATPWLIAKRTLGLTPDYGPVLTWLALDVWAVQGAFGGQLWIPSVLGLAVGVVTAVLAWHGGRAPLTTPAAAEPASVSTA